MAERGVVRDLENEPIASAVPEPGENSQNLERVLPDAIRAPLLRSLGCRDARQ